MLIIFIVENYYYYYYYFYLVDSKAGGEWLEGSSEDDLQGCCEGAPLEGDVELQVKPGKVEDCPTDQQAEQNLAYLS